MFGLNVMQILEEAMKRLGCAASRAIRGEENISTRVKVLLRLPSKLYDSTSRTYSECGLSSEFSRAASNHTNTLQTHSVYVATLLTAKNELIVVTKRNNNWKKMTSTADFSQTT